MAGYMAYMDKAAVFGKWLPFVIRFKMPHLAVV
jgi:hypothetical protein